MRLLKTHYHPAAKDLHGLSVFVRRAARAIVVRESKILLLYTERYQDYSLPGGGLDDGEEPRVGMARELAEETGAQDIRNIQPFGIYEEFRPWYRDDFDIVHMTSYCYTCEIDETLAEPSYESYELANGMKPVWIDIREAISHNKKTLKHSEKKGLSLEREIFLLETIAKECCEP